VSFIDRLRSQPAPVEAPAVERIQGPCCVSCGATWTELEPKLLGDFGAQPTCVDVSACLDRIGHVRRWW